MSANELTSTGSEELHAVEFNDGFQDIVSEVREGDAVLYEAGDDRKESRVSIGSVSSRRKEEEASRSTTGDDVAKTERRVSSVRKKLALNDSNQDDTVTDSEGERSRCFTFFAKLRAKEEHNWEPKFWQRLCPHPYFPTYSQFARNASLCIVCFLLWGIIYSIVGKDAAPRGALFHLALLGIAAHCGGWLMSLTTLPALIGMLIVGILFQNVAGVEIQKIQEIKEMKDGIEIFVKIDIYKKLMGVLRKTSLVIILTRAGLDLDPEALKRLWATVLKLGLLPWTTEAAVVAVLSVYLLDMPWSWAALLGSIVAAVSPAVVVPCLFRLRAKGYGVAKGIPTLIIAVAGIDDAASVAIFGIVGSIMFSKDSLAYQIVQGPLSILIGVGFGICWGVLAKFVPEKNDSFVVPMRVLMLLGGGLLAVFGSEKIGFEGAGPLGCITAAFVSSYVWSQQGWEIDEHPVAVAFEIFWMIFEPVLFGITGFQVVFSDLDFRTVYLGVAILAAGILLRIALTVAVAVGSGLNLKEKVFVALSWMAKATVQAALAPAALDHIDHIDDPTGKTKQHAEILLTVCILSILLTAPIGAILITLSGKRLLTRTSVEPALEDDGRPMGLHAMLRLSVNGHDEDTDHEG